MATADDPQRRGTPVPPRGKKAKPARPTAGRAPAAGRAPTAGRAPAANRTATNRRAAVARQRQQRQTRLAIAAIGVVVVVVAVFIIVKVAGGGSKPSAKGPSRGAVVPQSLYAEYTNTPVSTLQAAANNYRDSNLYGFPTVVNDPPISAAGKPGVVYIGAEYCPYCATERWALILALSKFGTFNGLTMIHSSSTDVYPNTPTWSFYKSTYTSPYLTFTSVEETTENESQRLQTPTASELRLYDKYDSVNGSVAGIPFVDFDGKALLRGVELNPTLLAGKTFSEDLTSIASGTSPLADAVDADAGAIVSDICRATGGKPANVCSSFPKPITST